MDIVKKIDEMDLMDGYKFVDEEAQNSSYCINNSVINAEDDLRDLLYNLKNDEYYKDKLQGDELNAYMQKVDGLIKQLDTLCDDMADIFKSRGLLVKETE